jgi:hypothetical protein
VPLPRITLERRDGARVPLPTAACRSLQAPYLNAVNDLIANAPGIGDLTDDGNGYPGRNPPNWRLFVNFSQAAIDLLLNNETGGSVRGDAQRFENDGPGFFSNRDISYVFTGTSRGFGEVLIVRGRAPTFANTRRGARVMPSGKQLRYWSFCQYEPATQRVIDCKSDDRVAVDRPGNYTLVVSTAANRPSNARTRCGVTWLPWGPQTQGLLIYRHMLADRGFEHAIQRVPEPGKERRVMAGYYPAGKYVAAKESFEARGCPAGR